MTIPGGKTGTETRKGQSVTSGERWKSSSAWLRDRAGKTMEKVFQDKQTQAFEGPGSESV